MTIKSILQHVSQDKRGATAVEYALILTMIVLVMRVALNGVASETIRLWTGVSQKSADAISGK
jgi:pilus assembly protein Flp/PilA